MDPEQAARAAIEGGPLLEEPQDVELGESVAVAVDVQTDLAAAYVVTRTSSREWQTDIVAFGRVDDGWEWRAEGGSSGTGFPFERDAPGREEGLTSVDLTWTSDGEHQIVAVAGSSTASVAAVELVARDADRRVEPHTRTGAFVVAVTLPADREVGADEVDVRAVDESGSVIDSTATWRAERAAALSDTVPVAEAAQLPDGSNVAVLGQLLVLEGRPVRLCDGIDTTSAPPEPLGPSLIVHGLSSADLPLSWTTPDMGVSVRMVVMSGTVHAGVLHPDS